MCTPLDLLDPHNNAVVTFLGFILISEPFNDFRCVRMCAEVLDKYTVSSGFTDKKKHEEYH